jgi:aminoglycoside phosphotransferase (APT) family kinase protein
VLAGGAARRLVRTQLQAALGQGARLERCSLYRAKFKPGRYLNAHFRATVTANGASSVRPVVTTWNAAPAREAPEARTLEAEARGRGLASPFDSLSRYVPEWNMELLISPLDARFPQLLRAVDPAYARATLASAYATSTDRLPTYTVSTVRYRPNERHVLRWEPDDSSRPTVFAKMARGNDVSRELRVAGRVAEWLSLRGDQLRGARPLNAVLEDNIILYEMIPGRALSALVRRHPGNVGRHLTRVGHALRALHRAPTDLASDLQRNEFGLEVKAIARASEHVAALAPRAAATITELLERATAVHSNTPQEDPTFVHGDFKADHLLIHGSTVTLMDFGTCRVADPALDLGKFLADLHYWQAGTRSSAAVEEMQAAFLSGYGPDISDHRLKRARIYEVLVLIKSTVRRVRLFERDWVVKTERLVDRSASLLDAIEAGRAA